MAPKDSNFKGVWKAFFNLIFRPLKGTENSQTGVWLQSGALFQAPKIIFLHFFNSKAPKSVFQILFWGSPKPLFQPSLSASRGPPWGQNWLPSAATCSFSLPAKAPQKSSEQPSFRGSPRGYRGALGPILKSIVGVQKIAKIGAPLTQNAIPRPRIALRTAPKSPSESKK